MRSKKLAISILFLITSFIYGVCVGKYKWFPYQKIAFTKKSFIRDKKLNNDRLLAELGENNNIEFKRSLNGLKAESSSTNLDSLKIISFGDNEFQNMEGLLNSINLKNSSLIVNVGDIIDVSSACTDSNINYQRILMSNLNAPVLYTPGDNEWRDCDRWDYMGIDNIERLDYIRETFFINNLTLGGNPHIVENQRMQGYPENARLKKKNIAFITAHVVGSQNNFDVYSKENTLEYLQRDEANIDWITKSFERYNNASAYVVIIHANVFTPKNIPLFFIQNFGSPDIKAIEVDINPYEKFASTLLKLSNKYKKPVLVLNGQGHKFRAFKPNSSEFPFLHVIQNFGSPDIKAIEIEINPSKKIPFNVTKLIDISI